uniref:Uncharacterized protein n=1 Tax=Neogobius melanostomus TaxID=47308 RepID=A0A8C6WKE0_9GOBI
MTGDANAKEVPCFVGGDVRSNENIALTALHTLMLREHNRLARKLSNLNPHWDGERLYQEARKILGGMSQVITYRDYLGFIVGPDAMAKRLSVYPGYDSEVNPGISNVFATAALRFGHLTIQPYVFRLDKNYEEHPDYPSPLLHKAFFAPWRVVFEGGVDPILRGLIGRPAKLNTQEHMAPDEIREKLFKFSEDLALDLASLNMQRGRDHGLPGYNAWRKFCGLSQPSNMYELGKVLRNYQMAQRLMILWWENNGVFTERQKRSLRDVSFARIICDNTGITEVPEQPFWFRPRGSGYSSCSNIPEMDLSPGRRTHSTCFVEMCSADTAPPSYRQGSALEANLTSGLSKRDLKSNEQVKQVVLMPDSLSR